MNNSIKKYSNFEDLKSDKSLETENTINNNKLIEEYNSTLTGYPIPLFRCISLFR